MAVKNYIICFLCFVNTSLSYCQVSNDWKVIDFIRKDYININVKEDWQNQKIYLISSVKKRDTITINEAVEIDTIMTRLNRFLVISYKIRGGSGEHLRLTKVFCLDDGEVKESLSLSTLRKSYSADGVIQDDYFLRLSFKYHESRYTANLVENIKMNRRTVKKSYFLKFDPVNRIFFSKKLNDAAFNICGEKSSSVKGYYKVSLSTDAYVYFKNAWYQKGSRCYIGM